LANTTQHLLFHQIRTFKNSILQFPNFPFSEILNSAVLLQIIEGSTHRRNRLFTPLVTLSAFIYQVLSIDGLYSHARKAWLWKGHHTLLVDGTTVLMPDTVENQQSFPQQSCQKQGLGFPIARIVEITSLSAGSVTAYCLGASKVKGAVKLPCLASLSAPFLKMSYYSLTDIAIIICNLFSSDYLLSSRIMTCQPN